MFRKTHFVILKKWTLPTIFLLFTICLVIFSKQNLSATKEGLLLWANSVVPALLPFFIATELLGCTSIVKNLGKLLNKVMRPIFNVPGIGAYAFLMGIISGYPIGAKIVTSFREQGLCTKEEAERLIAFTNNSGPLFIIGTVGVSLFKDTRTGFLLFITHILACISVGIIFRFWKYNKNSYSSSKYEIKNSKEKEVSFSNLGEVLGNSILNSINTVVMIGGFVVLFSVVLSILNNSNVLNMLSNILAPIGSLFNINSEFINALLTGIIELTNGVKQVSLIQDKAISINIIITAFLLGFGGISVLLQVFSIISKSDISIKSYIVGKLLHGTLAAFYTYIFIKNSLFFNLDLPVFNSFANNLNVTHNYSFFMVLVLLIILVTVKLFSKKINKKTN